ncbi:MULTISPECIES: hypothetical protein [unclassified Janthinobacterium]|nr:MULTISPECIES: hypothetical protein [unclassified Janthinobacterium]
MEDDVDAGDDDADSARLGGVAEARDGALFQLESGEMEVMAL